MTRAGRRLGSDPTGLTPRLLVLVALSVLATSCGGGEEASDVPLGRAVTTRTSITPDVHLFAEPVVARLDLTIDRERYDPGYVRVATSFLPYKRVGTIERTRQDHGRVTLLRYEQTLRCLSIDCIPQVVPSAAGEDESGRGERRIFRFGPARILYSEPEKEPRLIRRASWPPFESTSRMNREALPRYGFVFRTSVTTLPEPSHRASPKLLGAGLLAGALALLALPAGLAAGWLRRRRPPPPEEEPELPPLERAVLVVEWAQGREDGADRRRALEVLAVELETAERLELAEAARELAWSPASPSPDAAGMLVESVKESDGAHA